MYIHIEEEEKLITLWLTAADQEDGIVQHWLNNQYPRWTQKGYYTITFQSGTDNLSQSTGNLLCHNLPHSTGRDAPSIH